MMINKKVMYVIFVKKEDQILLGLKKRGYDKGKWDGFRGKVAPGETIVENAIRGLKQECGLTASELKQVGHLQFEFENEQVLLEVHVFETYKYEGELVESEEIQPQWFNVNKIPYDSMWSDSSLWFPWMLRNEHFKGYFVYQSIEHSIIKHNLEKWDIEEVND